MSERPSGSSGGLGLSTAQAKHRLLELMDGGGGDGGVRIPVPFHIDWRARAVAVLVGASVAVAVLLVASGACVLVAGGQGQGRRKQGRGAAAVAEGALVLLALAGALWVLAREARLEVRELDERLRAVAREIRAWTGTYGDLRTTPPLPTVATFLALRDGRWRDVPTLLLVEGDVVGRERVDGGACVSSIDGVEVERISADGISVDGADKSGKMALFVVRAPPLRAHLALIAQHHRRAARSVLQNQAGAVARLCVLRVLPAAAVAAAAAAAAQAATSAAGGGAAAAVAEAVAGRTAHVLLPFACAAAWAVLWVCGRVACTARVVAVFDALQRSKTEYEDTADIDAFDVEALPPTKDVAVGARAVAARARWLWAHCDYRNLARSTSLAETLGNVTVICCVDREGTIAEPLRVPEQIVVPAADDVAVLDLDGAAIVDDGWQAHLPALRPLALACGLAGASAASHGLARISRAVGVARADLAPFRVLRSLRASAQQQQPGGGGGPLCLEAVVVQPAAAATATAAAGLQMLAHGGVELVLAMCLDYFDGCAVRPLDDRATAMFYGLHLNALQQDLQCLAFAYRPLALDAAALRWLRWDQQPAATSAQSAR
ncbi:hypothetical protein GGH95_002187, partial [Coemansia sp. RSA 1836]